MLDQPIGTREEKDVGKPIPAGTVIKDELLSPKASAIRKSRSISIKTDDGVGDVEEKETADQADLDVEKMYSALHQFNVFEKDLISLIVSKRISYRQLLRTKYTEKYDEVIEFFSFSYVFGKQSFEQGNILIMITKKSEMFYLESTLLKIQCACVKLKFDK